MKYKFRNSSAYFKRFRISVVDNGFLIRGSLLTALYKYPTTYIKFLPVSTRNNKIFFQLFSPFLIRWIPSAVRGVSVGYSIEFTLNAVSFKGEYLRYSRALSLDLGYSHLVCFILPRHAMAVFEKRKLTIMSPDINWITNSIESIKNLRYPDSYRAKGIILKGESFKLKPGKQRQ